MIYPGAQDYKINHYLNKGGRPNADGISLVPVINLMLGSDVVGAEIGVGHARTTCTLLQNCLIRQKTLLFEMILLNHLIPGLL